MTEHVCVVEPPAPQRPCLPNLAGCDSLKLIGPKLVYAPKKPLSRREQALRRKIEGSILRAAAVNGAEISEEEVRRRIYREEARKKVSEHKPFGYLVWWLADK